MGEGDGGGSGPGLGRRLAEGGGGFALGLLTGLAPAVLKGELEAPVREITEVEKAANVLAKTAEVGRDSLESSLDAARAARVPDADEIARLERELLEWNRRQIDEAEALLKGKFVRLLAKLSDETPVRSPTGEVQTFFVEVPIQVSNPNPDLTAKLRDADPGTPVEFSLLEISKLGYLYGELELLRTVGTIQEVSTVPRPLPPGAERRAGRLLSVDLAADEVSFVLDVDGAPTRIHVLTPSADLRQALEDLDPGALVDVAVLDLGDRIAFLGRAEDLVGAPGKQ